MSKLKTPHEKKKASYQKDHRTGGEHPKAARSAVPRTKARLEREHRHALHQSLKFDIAPAAAVDVDRLDAEVGGLRREQLEKEPGVPLLDHIEDRKSARGARVGRHARKRARTAKKPS